VTARDKKSKGAKAAPFQHGPSEIMVWLSGRAYISAVSRRIGSSISPNTIAAIEEEKPNERDEVDPGCWNSNASSF
jgi:hypothetical protein